jgi:hypothetical protein
MNAARLTLMGISLGHGADSPLAQALPVTMTGGIWKALIGVDDLTVLGLGDHRVSLEPTRIHSGLSI